MLHPPYLFHWHALRCERTTTLAQRKLGRTVKMLFPNSVSRVMTRSRALDCTRWSASAAGFFSAGCHYAKALTRGAPHTDARAPGWGVDDWTHRALLLIKSWPVERVRKYSVGPSERIRLTESSLGKTQLPGEHTAAVFHQPYVRL